MVVGMNNWSHKNSTGKPPPRQFLPVLERLKGVYLSWCQFYQILPKTHRYSLGLKIDNLFIEAIESITVATFLPKESKLPFVRLAIRKMDTLKVLLMVLWEAKSLEEKKYVAILLPIDEVGRMLGGWYEQLAKAPDQARNKQNSPAIKTREK